MYTINNLVIFKKMVINIACKESKKQMPLTGHINMNKPPHWNKRDEKQHKSE